MIRDASHLKVFLEVFKASNWFGARDTHSSVMLRHLEATATEIKDVHLLWNPYHLRSFVEVAAECNAYLVCSQCSLWSWEFDLEYDWFEGPDVKWCQRLLFRNHCRGRVLFVLVQRRVNRKKKQTGIRAWFEFTSVDWMTEFIPFRFKKKNYFWWNSKG